MDLSVRVVQAVGILDGKHTTQLRAEIDEVLSAGAKHILLDLKEVTFMDSSGLGGLVAALKDVRSAGGKLYICSINEQIRILFELTSMDQVFSIFANQDEFNKAVLPTQ
jgi:anti-anti-sigma factor